MTNPRWLIAGVALLAVIAALAALSGVSTTPQASAQQVPCGSSVDAPTCPPAVRSATPTITATAPATSTPVPPTAMPTQPPATATATKPAGGSGGQAVTPPNTGSGPDSGSNLYLLLAAGFAAAIGTGSLAVAVRRSRS